MKLLPSFYQVGGPALTHPNDATAFLLPVGEKLALIDCCTPEGYDALLQNIRALGFDPADVLEIYATHGHYDHIGAAALFERDFGTTLHLHGEDRAAVDACDPIMTTARLLYGQDFPPVRNILPLTDGERMETDAGVLEVIHTPGHTPGSCCFALEHVCGIRVLIAGDTLHGGFSHKIGSDEARWRESLDRLCSLDFDCYVMGHCNPILFCDANRRIDSLRRSFANYYTPWFKTFYESYPY
ncbi:MAG: MBL fold metallo-hydrolase [Oscillospiraceae bacterium]|nr:MBL fold metallo-hydrolase [Oscillospiraceae bacterium]